MEVEVFVCGLVHGTRMAKIHGSTWQLMQQTEMRSMNGKICYLQEMKWKDNGISCTLGIQWTHKMLLHT